MKKDLFALHRILYIIAALGVIGGISMVIRDQKTPKISHPVTLPSSSPYKDFFAGAGIIEAQTENIKLGSLVSGIVEKVLVEVGAHVKKGEPLFSLNPRQAKDALNSKLAQLEKAKASIIQAQTNLNDAQDKFKLVKGLKDASAISKEEFITRRNNVMIAEAALQSAKADIKTAEADVETAQTTLDLQRIRAPIDCTILQINIHPGEYVPTTQLATPLMILGGVQNFHIRVDIDETDAWRFQPNTNATAFLRGNSSIKIPLKFQYTEPYVVPKKSLTGDSTERIDVRVLQVIYSFDPKDMPSYIGQQVDVYIEAPPS